ncbi:MAG: ShlB/FhaC/HecB family hemolysin secretion/activation protein [Thiohalocapsa sp.]
MSGDWARRHRRIWPALTALALALLAPAAANAQAPPIAPLVTPPVQRVVPAPTPQVLPPPAPPTASSEPVPPGPPARIDDIGIEGVTVYDPAQVRAQYADLIGRTVPRERLLAAVESLQTRYRADGWILTTVHGEAERRDGRLIFVIRVAEGYVSDVKLDGDIGDAGTLALAILQHLTERRPTNNADLERYLLLVNDIPGVTASGVLRRRTDSAPGAVELVAQVGLAPFGAQFQYDNRGSAEVGPHEGLLVGQANAFTRFGTQLQGMFFNTFNREQVFGQVDTTSFLNSEGLKSRLYFGRGNTQPGGALAGTGFNADLQVAGASLAYPVIRSRRRNLSIDADIDTYDSLVETFLAGGEASETHLRIGRLGAALDFQDAVVANLPAANNASLKLSHGFTGFGASKNTNILPARLGNVIDFAKVSGEMTRVQNLVPFGDVQPALKVSLGGQFTNDILPPSEEYLLGGTRFGRGFFSGQVAGDRAIGTTIELQFNTGWEDASPFGPNKRLDVQFYGFFDYGRGYNLVPGSVDRTVDSFGLGVRSNLAPFLYVELEGVHRLTTHASGALAKPDAGYAVFSRVLLQY